MKKTLSLFALIILAACASSRGTLTPFKDPQTGLYGFKGANGVVVIDPEYEDVKPFDEFGMTEVLIPGKGWTLMDRFGSVVEGK